MTSDFVHDPDGIVLFREPTEVEVRSGGASSTTTVRVLPFSARRDGGVFWVGPDTYRIPEDAEFTILEDLDISKGEIGAEIDTEGNERISLASLLKER